MTFRPELIDELLKEYRHPEVSHLSINDANLTVDVVNKKVLEDLQQRN